MANDFKKKMGKNLDYFNTPCTIKETVQIAKGVAEDVITDYQRRVSPAQIASSIQIEILKKLLIESGIITEERFRQEYGVKIKEFNENIKNYQEESADAEEDTDESEPVMDMNVSDIDVKKE